MLNHNIETVARLQRAVRPSAGYARSLAVLARARQAGLTTKSGLIVGMGEREDEVLATLADLRGVGVDIVTVGQYLRPSRRHLPVARYWTPEEFERLAPVGDGPGFAHVEASPLTRSSYHARQAAETSSRRRRPVASSGAGGDGGRRGRRLMERLGAGARQWRHQRMARVRARMACSSAWTPCCCPTGPTCPGSPGTGPCPSSG